LKNDELIIKENSWIARIAAWKLGCRSVALVLGSTIYLHNASRNEFLKNERWVKHERCHLKQFREHGYLGFIIKYLWESVRHGYYNNRFEVEARQAELS
jgi:hypothetical protein